MSWDMEGILRRGFGGRRFGRTMGVRGNRS
jgi:hypothetical protein